MAELFVNDYETFRKDKVVSFEKRETERKNAWKKTIKELKNGIPLIPKFDMSDDDNDLTFS